MNSMYSKWRSSFRNGGTLTFSVTSEEMYNEAIKDFRAKGKFIEPAKEFTEFDISKPKEITVFLFDKNHNLIYKAPIEVPENYQFKEGKY